MLTAIAASSVAVTPSDADQDEPRRERSRDGADRVERVEEREVLRDDLRRVAVTKRARTGSVPPISVVGTIIATTANATRRTVR